MKGRLIHKDTSVFYGNIGEFACNYKSTNYYVGDTFMLEGEGNTIIVKDNNSEVFLMGYRGCTLKGDLSSIYHKIVRIKRYTDLSDGDIIDCIMVILENNESKEYYGDEILKMMREGKLKENDRLFGKYDDSDKSINEFIIENDGNNLCLKEIINHTNWHTKEIDFWQLLHVIFTIKEKEYFTFDEARKSGKKFKYKTWNNYRNIQEVCRKLPGCMEINKMLDEKAWEVED